ncbi:hypothetical protein KJ693_12025, partial [bacterium]|nr:hypothetical protein [bacterium]
GVLQTCGLSLLLQVAHVSLMPPSSWLTHLSTNLNYGHKARQLNKGGFLPLFLSAQGGFEG